MNFLGLRLHLKTLVKLIKKVFKNLGAKGIVEIDNQLKIILGPDSKNLKKYIDELK